MKRFLIGLLSALLLVGSFMGASAKRPRPPRTGPSGDPAMWI
jgi:hypothetical protein